jgi:hypothetical protein
MTGLACFVDGDCFALPSGFVAIDGEVGSGPLPSPLGEAGGLVEMGSTAFCASMSFNSKTEGRLAPS